MIQPEARDLPAILLGWEQPARKWFPRADTPSWMASWDHNFGGHMPDEYGVIESMMIGALLPLEDNLRHGKMDLRVFIAGLRDDDDREKHFHTRDGDSLSDPRMARLRESLAGFLRLPDVSEATEALVKLAPEDPLNHFEGWAVHPVGDARVFDETFASELAAAGRALELPSTPRAFLVWWNCGL